MTSVDDSPVSAEVVFIENLETAENVARTILYADCLFRNEKYKQAAVSFCVLCVFLVLLSTIVIITVMSK